MSEEIRLKNLKTIRGRRFFKKKCPLLNENDRSTLLITNGKGGVGKEFLVDMKLIKNPLVFTYELKQKIALFEDPSKLEPLFRKFNSSLFITSSHSKKRPNNVIFGRTFDHQILDMYEFGITDYKSMSSSPIDKFNAGSKPILIFTDFPNDSENQPNFYLKSLLIDMFRGPKIKNINRVGVDHCIHFQAINNEKILMTVCKVNTKMVDERREVADVVEVGASCTLNIRRQQLPNEEIWKKALRKPSAVKAKKQKNIEKDVFGNVFGRVHIGKEDKDQLSKLVAGHYHKRLRKFEKKQVEHMEVE